MINALCDLVNGKDVPRPRIMSERLMSQPPTSRLPSTQARSTSSKLEDVVTTKKAALQPSESNTDVESVVSTPGSLSTAPPNTRRKAKDVQTRLGKGRPVVAGGSGARKITKAFSKGNGRKAKTSMVLHPPIAEEEEEPIQKFSAPTVEKTESSQSESAVPTSPAQLPPPRIPTPQDLNETPAQLPTPAPSHPSYSLPQISVLESRITHLESSEVASRLSKVEDSLSLLQSPLAELPFLKDLFGMLQKANAEVESRVSQLTKIHAELETRAATLENQVKELLQDNTMLKRKISELENTIQATENVSKIGVVATVSNEGRQERKPGDALPNPVPNLTLVPADPSPAPPALGKRFRSDTPDTSGIESAPKADADMDAIHRVKRPQRKKPRLDHDEDTIPFIFSDKEAGPSSTSTPKNSTTSRQKPTDESPGFFPFGPEVPTPLEKKKDNDDMEYYLQFDDDSAPRSDKLPEADKKEDSKSPERPQSAIPRTPSPKIPKLSSTFGDRALNPIYDPSYFAGMHPIFQSHVQASELPFPLIPATPPNSNDLLNQSAQYATPRLGEPWRSPRKISDTQVSGIPTISESDNPESSGTTKSPPSPGSYALRPSGSRRERNDKYNPYFTPQRGPSGARQQRTGLTPIRGFSSGLKSPAPLSTVAEDEREETVQENTTEVSPPQLRTLYGTELDGDTRFGDYGRDLGRDVGKLDWSKFLPR